MHKTTSRKLLCGRCGRPLGIGMARPVHDTIKGILTERTALYCDNTGCNTAVYVIEETAVRSSPFAGMKRFFGREA